MPHKRKKVSVIGSGFVGSSCAHWILSRDLADVSLIDINDGLAKGKALDLFSASPVTNASLHLQGGSDYNLTEGSDIVIITAGLARTPGMSRADLLLKNAHIMKSICSQLKKSCPEAIFIVVSNPLDAMVFLAHQILQPPREKILGMAGILDTARFKAFVAEKLDLSVQDISALVLGGHGDNMVPLIRYSSAGSIPLSLLLDKASQSAIVERTRKGGGEIVSLLKTGSAHYAPALSAVEMATAILKDQNRILPCSALLKGEYGEKGIFMGVPCQLSGKGLEKIIEIPLNAEEESQFRKSAESVKKLIAETQDIIK